MKRFLVNLTFFFCFFPFLKVLPIQAETQPIAGVIGFFIIVFYGVKKNRYTVTLLWFMFIILGYAAISSILRPAILPEIVLNTVAYFIPLLIFLSLYDKIHLLSVRLYFVALLMWFALGCVQYFGFFGFLRPVLDGALGLIISRYSSGPLGGGRGVVFFSQEPSAGATSIILFMLTAVFFHASKRVRRGRVWGALVGSIVMLLLNKSANGMLLLLIFAVGLLLGYCTEFLRSLRYLTVRREVVYALLRLTMIPAVVSASIFFLRSEYAYQSRILQVIPVVWDRVVVKKDVGLDLFASLGGTRFPLMYVGYRSLGHNYGVGRGVASWRTDFVPVARSCGVFLEDFPLLESERKTKFAKPNAYAGTVAFDTGIPGLFVLVVFLTLFVVSKVTIIAPATTSAAASAILIVSLVQILFMGLITLPMPWLGLCYVYHLNRRVCIDGLSGRAKTDADTYS